MPLTLDPQQIPADVRKPHWDNWSDLDSAQLHGQLVLLHVLHHENNNRHSWLRHFHNGIKEYPGRDRCRSLLKSSLSLDLNLLPVKCVFYRQNLILGHLNSSLRVIPHIRLTWWKIGTKVGLIFIKLFKTKLSPSAGKPREHFPHF